MDTDGGGDWGTLSYWRKFTDKDSRRPEKTWRNRIFWTLPISHYGNIKKYTSRPRFEFGKQQTSNGLKPYLEIRTTKFKGETYKNIPLSNSIRINWWGWFWGWK